MNPNHVLMKTSDGAKEIKSRALGLAPRIRTALLLVDGVKSVAELERLMKAAGITGDALQLLLDKGLIHFVEQRPAVTPPLSSTNKKESAEPAKTAPEFPKTQLEVATLMETETVLDVATKAELGTLLGVATLLEAVPTQVHDTQPMVYKDEAKPATVEPVKAQIFTPTERPAIPKAAAGTKTVTHAAAARASMARMNFIVARAHTANALDQYLGIDGYLLKQRVVACESRSELEKSFRLVEAALHQKIDKAKAVQLIGTAQALLNKQ